MKKSIVELIDDNLKFENEVINITWNNQEIEVKGYISIEEKRQLIQWVIAQNRRNSYTNFLNSLDIDKKFDIAIVNFYTNFKFDIVNKDYYNEVYEILNTNHFFDLIVSSIPEKEYEYLKCMLQEEIKKDFDFQCTMAGNINRLLDKFNSSLQNSDTIIEKLNNFDINKYTMVSNLATHLGKDNKMLSQNINTTIENKE